MREGGSGKARSGLGAGAVGLLLMLLAACEPHPAPAPAPEQVERWQYDAEGVRRAVDAFKSEPSPQNRRRVLQAFALFDDRVRSMERQAAVAANDAERAAIEERIADLLHKRELHRSRCATPGAAPVPVRVAERVR